MTCSPMRKKYIAQFIGRILIMAAVVLLLFFCPESFSVMDGMNFFRRFSLLHLLWALWMVHMVLQLLPARKVLAMGSQKFRSALYAPGDSPSEDAFRAFRRRSNQGAAYVFLVWLVLTLVLGILHRHRILDRAVMLLISTFFFLCDLICVLYWCPFRVLLMKNRCCTTCRIFNWDHLMMFSIMAFVPGFFSLSLFAMSVAVFLVWEITFYRHPERFWARTNRALRCVSCTDKLCGNRLSMRKQ